MNRTIIGMVAFFAATLTGLTAESSTLTVDVVGKRFDAPRIYFTSATLNKGGVVSAVRGQDNFLRLFVSAVKKENGTAFSDPLTYTVDFPEGVEILSDERLYPHLHPVTFNTEIDSNGTKRVRATGQIDPKVFKSRCVANTFGVEMTLWFRADQLSVGPGGPIGVTLEHHGKLIFSDRAHLHVYEELIAPPPVRPEYFTLHLHYGPEFREGKWDELADYLRRAGINAIMTQVYPSRLQDTNRLQVMQARGFFTIAQRGGSYHPIREELAQGKDIGPDWFARNDGGGMAQAMPYTDAVLWNFEPVPRIVTNATMLARFRKTVGLPPSTPLDASIIRSQYHQQWIEFRQNMFADAVRSWATWSRSLKPDVKTLVTEGQVGRFHPAHQIDYRKYYQTVTSCSPMNWNGLRGVLGMREWQAAAPEARFAGCMNVANKSVRLVTVPANTIMLQIACAALMGNTGTEIYPGQTMDGEDFVVMNRVMGFLGRNQSIIWEGRVAPPELRFTPLPKEDYEVALGGGKVIRNRYPDWDRELVQQTYQQADGEGYLAALVNWNAVEPCYTRIQVAGLTGEWMLVDRERRQAYTLHGKRALDPVSLADGCIVRTPAADFRGFHLVRYHPDEVADFTEVDLMAVDRDYQAYSSREAVDAETNEGAIQFGFDDIDGDNLLEYKISTRSQTVWISRTGHIVRWKAGNATLDTAGFGLCRDQLWLPQSERHNKLFDSMMALEKRKAHADHAEIVLARTVPLESPTGVVDMRLTRRYIIDDAQPGISVEVEFENTSLAAEHSNVTMSYRVHHHLSYDHASQVWMDDGEQLSNLGLADNISIPNKELTASESEMISSADRRSEAMYPAQFGDYFPDQKMLLTFMPDDASALLQVLRWLAADRTSGTIEWMYRPVEIKSGERWKAQYRMTLQDEITKLEHSVIKSNAESPPVVSNTKGKLLFHAGFNDRADADFAAGDSKAVVTGPLAFGDTPTGRGVRAVGKTDIRYRPEGNIDLTGGSLFVRFMPLWEGSAATSHHLFKINSSDGYVYFAKLADGRLIMNMSDGHRQTWTATPAWAMSVHNYIQAGTWYEVMFLWDAERGAQSLYLDGRKLAERKHRPWKPLTLKNDDPKCVMWIPSGAEVVIDDLRIWGQL